MASLGEQHNVRGVLLDTQGPEIRTGNLEGNAKISLVQGSTIELTTDPVRFSQRDAYCRQGGSWYKLVCGAYPRM